MSARRNPSACRKGQRLNPRYFRGDPLRGKHSAHVSVGGTPAISRQDVENEVATTLAGQLNQPVPKVVCPAYPVKLRVNAVSGKQAHFSIVVSKTPVHFTAPS